MLGAAGEHAVGLGGGLGDQVVDQDADVGLIAAEDEVGSAACDVLGGVDAGDEALAGGFFVAAGAVDLAGEEQAARSCFVSSVARMLRRPDHVVFDGVAAAEDLGVLQAAG